MIQSNYQKLINNFYSVSQSIEVRFKTSPPTPLLIKERGDIELR
ncbi:hypothetical protein NIES267_50520 [Calothrix parasitica NIES-267]|uniref:Uncharacterized protein n=1 Tax=Calothrix parasitica NIES-267 TaxID=1973488 RepID=A0A1Z4LWE5_9CYAN|nr:hypothetical protein NIES267_50520 [Calothrix parasitica NIES-267]